MEKGKLEKDLEIAKKMKAEDFDAQMIQKFTDFSGFEVIFSGDLGCLL